MAFLFIILRNSFVVWSRSFALIYVFFLFMLIASFVLGPGISIGMNTRTLVLWGLLLLIFSAFMAGFYYMVSMTCQNYMNAREENLPQKLPTRKREAVTSAFGLFRDFFPGIGQFFLSIAIGYCIQFGVLAALAWNLNPLWLKAMPILIRTESLLSAGKSPEQVATLLSPAQQVELGQFGMGILVIGLTYGFFSLLTLLWPVFTVMYGENPFKAYGRSIKQFFKDPGRLLLLSLMFLGGKLLLTFLTLSAGMFIDILGRLSLLLLEIYMTVTLFIYAWYAVGKPTVTPDAIEPPPETPSFED